MAETEGKKTICGYEWNDIYTALFRSIANGDMRRSQRWAAELLCSETGVSRLEAVLFAAWSEHVNSAQAKWPAVWHAQIAVMRNEFVKAGGDNRTFRNTQSIRNKIAECVGYLVVSAKRPRPALPKQSDIYKEADAVKTRLHSGGAAPDQPSTGRVWDTKEDAPTLRTLGNELESAIRTAQTSKALFWMVWIMTLDSQKTKPTAKDRAPSNISGKARLSLAWYIHAILTNMAETGLDSNRCIFQTLELMKLTWMRLGVKFRKDIYATVIVMLTERIRSAPIEVRIPHEVIDTKPVRVAIEDIDAVYEEIARDMKVVPTATPGEELEQAAVETAKSKRAMKKELKEQRDKSTVESNDKMEKAYQLMRKLYGMDKED